MKYRILIRTVNVNVASFSWFLGAAPSGNTPWETEDRAEALERYQELLNNNPLNNLTLVQIVPIEVSVSAENMNP